MRAAARGALCDVILARWRGRVLRSIPLIGYLCFLGCELASAVVSSPAYSVELQATPIKCIAEIGNVLIPRCISVSDLPVTYDRCPLMEPAVIRQAGSYALDFHWHGGFISDANPSMHVFRLICRDFFHRFNGLLEAASLQSKDNGLHKSDERQGSGDVDGPPFGRRLAILFGGALCGLILQILGWDNFDKNRKILGATLLGGGVLFALFGFGLWWLTCFRWSWGWSL